MHELAICQAIMGQLQHIAKEHRADRIVRVVLRIGPLSGVEPDLLRQAFPIASAGSVADGAELAVESQPIRVRCEDCGQTSQVEPNRLVCGYCNSYRTRLESGDELLLASVDLDRT